MNILLWILQAVVALYCFAGAAWRFTNFEEAAKTVASLGALPQGLWNIIGLFEIVCALGLLLPGILRRGKDLTVAAAAGLAVEMLLVSGVHLRYFGLDPSPRNPAMWTLMLAALSAFVAYGRKALRPL
jgi:hypothetical protein